MNKAERAIKALNEAADALDDMPFRRTGLFGNIVNPERLREEAKYIEDSMSVLNEASKESE